MKVAIIHPWFPRYREALFSEMVAQAGAVGIELDIFYGQVPPEWSQRGDASSMSIAQELPTRFIRIGNRSLAYKQVKAVLAGKYDAIVVEQAVRNLETYALLFSRSKLAFWGHGRTYTEKVSFAQERLKMWLTRRGRWFFAYTQGGAQATRDAGFPADRISVVLNSTDTKQLRQLLATAEPSRLGLGPELSPRSTFLYMGGLDGSKRLPFLFEAATLAREKVSNLRLLIVGDGPGRAEVESFADHHDWVTYLGRLDGQSKADALKASAAVVMPGRVGLVAVDAIACRLPVLTTDWPFHAPEFEYLQPGVNAIITRDSVTAFANAMSDYSINPALVQIDSQRADEIAVELTAEGAAKRFVEGLISLRAREAAS